MAEEEEGASRRRRRRQAEEGSGEEGEGSGEEESAEGGEVDNEDGGGGGNGTVADGEDGGNSTKKEIDLSIFEKRCKPEKVIIVISIMRLIVDSDILLILRLSPAATQHLDVVRMSFSQLKVLSRKAVWTTQHVKRQGTKRSSWFSYQSSLRFGCCRDGYTMATGLAFAGCPTGKH